MFGWIPRWHPFVWLAVIVLIGAIISNPVGMGGRAGDLLHGINHALHQILIFVESI